MRLQSDIVIRRMKEDVWHFLAEPGNIAKWDRGVKEVEARDAATATVEEGFEFETVGHGRKQNQGRMAYRVGETDPERGCRVDLISSEGNARYFRSASWNFRVDEISEGARVECLVDFELRLRYLWLAPMLFAFRRGIERDLRELKRVLERG